MKPKISAKRTPALDEDDLRQLNDLSFTSVIAEIARSEERPLEDPKRSRSERDLTATHTDRTINELLDGATSSSDAGSGAERRKPSARAAQPEAAEATGDLIDPTMLFPELHLKE
jgi:hypothetical protein